MCDLSTSFLINKTRIVKLNFTIDIPIFIIRPDDPFTGVRNGKLIT